MKEINFKKVIKGESNSVVSKVTDALKEQGFGILTRIDLDSKIKEKVGKEINPVIILGACNPKLAYEAYMANPDVTGLLPCNAVIRQIGPSEVSVEFIKPTALMEVLGDEKLINLSKDADNLLLKAMETLSGS